MIKIKTKYLFFYVIFIKSLISLQFYISVHKNKTGKV